MDKEERKNKKIGKKAAVILLIIIFLGIAASVFAALKLAARNGRVFHSKTDISAKNTVYFYQADENWCADTLGTSKYKMSDSGCLVSCIAAAMNMQGIDDTDPGRLNARLSAGNAYDSEGNLQWEAAEKVLGLTVIRKNSANISSDELDSLLSGSIYPIAKVKLSYGVGHFVLITGSENGEYLCMDPLKDKSTPVPLSEFSDRIYFIRYIEK